MKKQRHWCICGGLCVKRWGGSLIILLSTNFFHCLQFSSIEFYLFFWLIYCHPKSRSPPDSGTLGGSKSPPEAPVNRQKRRHLLITPPIPRFILCRHKLVSLRWCTGLMLMLITLMRGNKMAASQKLFFTGRGLQFAQPIRNWNLFLQGLRRGEKVPEKKSFWCERNIPGTIGTISGKSTGKVLRCESA